MATRRQKSCPDCGNTYSGLTQHWRMSGCEFPEYTDGQIKIVEGLLFGDGTIYKRDGQNAVFQIGSSQKTFLKHLQSFFGVLAGKVSLSESASDIASRNNSESIENCRDHYKLRLTANEQITNLYYKWYPNGKKKIPDGISIDDELFKYWYACDGSLKDTHTGSPTVGIANVSMDSDRVSELISTIGGLRNNSGNWFTLYTSDGQRYLDRTKPVPGYEYKWDY